MLDHYEVRFHIGVPESLFPLGEVGCPGLVRHFEKSQTPGAEGVSYLKLFSQVVDEQPRFGLHCLDGVAVDAEEWSFRVHFATEV